MNGFNVFQSAKFIKEKKVIIIECNTKAKVTPVSKLKPESLLHTIYPLNKRISKIYYPFTDKYRIHDNWSNVYRRNRKTQFYFIFQVLGLLTSYRNRTF